MKTRIAELRKENGLTLKQLGEILNVKDNALSQYETGKRTPQVPLLQEMASFFNVSLEYLTCLSDKRDYPVDSFEDSLKLLNMLNDKEIKYNNLSYKTSIELSLWIIQNKDFIKENHSNLVSVSNSFLTINKVNSAIIQAYSDIRTEQNDAVKKIEDALSSVDDAESNYKYPTANVLLKFMEESQRIGQEKTQKILKEMEKIPNKN
ncbi:helix-turn-helix domain-containing protein [Levilactobacillus brevis]|uniref:helix-turn-helix domain-containing protein n=1 Tax=Levilactobacillus brevis TaxID=1580 RepID=UPI00339C3040